MTDTATNPTKKPEGELVIRTMAMPKDTNPSGDIFGGWLVSQMDLAGASFAGNYSGLRVTTVAIESMTFLAPVHVGDAVCCYAKLIKVGRSSMRINIQAWAIGLKGGLRRQVTEGIFTLVAIDDAGRPIPVHKPIG